jgi:galactokinase
MGEAERRAWAAIERLADKQEKLDDVLVLLTEAQMKTEERFQQTDERIDKLVSAVGEFIRPRNGGTH